MLLDRQESFFCDYFEAASFDEVAQVVRSGALGQEALEYEGMPQICNELLAQEDIDGQRVAGVIAIFDEINVPQTCTK